MDQRVKELLQNYVNKSYEELVALAKNSLSILIPYFHSLNAELGDKAIIHFILTALAVDDGFSELEYKFLCDVLNTNESYDKIKGVVAKNANDQSIALADTIFDNIPNDNVKAELLNLFLCIIAIDETISPTETAMFSKLLQ